MFQVAKKASVLKRRKSRNRMEQNASRTETNTPGPGTPLGAPLSDADMQGIYSEEGKS